MVYSSGIPTKEGHGTVGTSKEEGQEVDERTTAHSLSRQTEKILAVKTGEEKVLLRPHGNLPRGGYREAGKGLFVRNSSGRKISNGYKLKGGKFMLDFREKFFTVRLVRYWNRLSKEVLDVPDLAVL